ncbi:hypothetical protein D6D06_02797 [Aureobasidium pullulans]|nr:hypothetical protein D6D06_02797 [Aureobasidium pullulans]
MDITKEASRRLALAFHQADDCLHEVGSRRRRRTAAQVFNLIEYAGVANRLTKALKYGLRGSHTGGKGTYELVRKFVIAKLVNVVFAYISRGAKKDNLSLVSTMRRRFRARLRLRLEVPNVWTKVINNEKLEDVRVDVEISNERGRLNKDLLTLLSFVGEVILEIEEVETGEQA